MYMYNLQIYNYSETKILHMLASFRKARRHMSYVNSHNVLYVSKPYLNLRKDVYSKEIYKQRSWIVLNSFHISNALLSWGESKFMNKSLKTFLHVILKILKHIRRNFLWNIKRKVFSDAVRPGVLVLVTSI